MAKATDGTTTERPDTAPKARSARCRGLTTGRLLNLYNDALRNEVEHRAFVALVQGAGGYRTRLAAQQRLQRLYRDLAARGLSLVPLKGGKTNRASNKALRQQFACLVEG